MHQLIKSYYEKYGAIPKDYYERFLQLLHQNKITDKDIPFIRNEIQRIQSIRYETLYFIFFLEPSACPRPRLNSRFRGKSSFVFVKGAKEHKDIFDEFIETVGNYPIIKTPCKMFVEVFSPIPSQMHRYEKVLAELKLIDDISQPDFDNYAKRYADMIQKTLILNDSLIVDGRLKKKYSSKPRIEIIIKYATSYDCKYNEKKVSKWKM